MKAAANPCQVALRQRLAAAGGWINRPELAHGLGYSEPRVDDELACMVMAGSVVYNERGRMYRLAGTPLALSALKRLVSQGPGHRHVVLGRQSTDKQRYQVGMARRLPGPDGAEQLVMAEMDMPYPAGAAALAQLASFLLHAAGSGDTGASAGVSAGVST